VSGHEPDRIEAGQKKHIQQNQLFDPPGIACRQRQIQRGHARKMPGQLRGQKQARNQQQRAGHQPGLQWQIAAGKRALPFGWMSPVSVQIGQIVDDIDAGRAQAKNQKGPAFAP